MHGYMHGGMCKCPHHLVGKLLMVLAWVAGILFFWSSWGTRTFWGFDALYWAWSVVILFLMGKASMVCGCCRWGMGMKMGMKMGMDSKMEDKKKMCNHEGDCKCGDCDRCK